MTVPTEDTSSGSYYSLKALLTRSPEDLKDAILLIAGFLAALLIDGEIDPLWVAAGGGALLAFLRLVYVGPARKAKEDEVALQGIALGRAIEGGVTNVTVVESGGAKNKKGDKGQSSLVVILLVIAVICILFGLITTAKWLIIVAVVVALIALFTRSRV